MWKNPHGRIKEPKEQHLNNIPKSYHIFLYIYTRFITRAL